MNRYFIKIDATGFTVFDRKLHTITSPNGYPVMSQVIDVASPLFEGRLSWAKSFYQTTDVQSIYNKAAA